MNRKYQIELEQAADGRWIAELEDLSSAIVYGNPHEKAIMNIKSWHRVFLDRLKHGEVPRKT